MKLVLIVVIIFITRRLLQWIHEDIPDWTWAQSLPLSTEAWHGDLYNILASIIIILFAIGIFMTLWRTLRQDAASLSVPQPPLLARSRGIVKIILIILTLLFLIYMNSYICLLKFLEIGPLPEFSWYTRCELTALFSLIIILTAAYLVIRVLVIRTYSPPATAQNNSNAKT